MATVWTPVILVLGVLLVPASVRTQERAPGLYTSQDSLVILNDTSFHDTVSGRQHAWLVEFYASWCGYCRNFAPVFAEFAGEVAAWGDVIRVAAIDCGDEVNAETICAAANLSGYPTIKYYAPFSLTRDGDTGYNRASHLHTGEALLVDTIDWVEAMVREMTEINPNISSLWPSLGPLEAGPELGLADLWPQDTEVTFVVVEREDSYIGRQIILDTWRREAEHAAVRRLPVSAAAVDATLARLNLTQLPAVAVFSRAGQTVTALEAAPSPGHGVKEALERQIREYIGGDTSETSTAAAVTEAEASTVQPASEGEVIRRRYTVHLGDLDKTVMFSLHSEVALRSAAFTPAQEAALRDYLRTLAQFYPAHSAVFPLVTRLQAAANLSLASLRTILDTEAAHLAPARWRWAGCRGSEARYGGYSCGLWSLWHALTVAQLEAGAGDPRAVLRAMISYVREFFGCRGCARHFLQLVGQGARVEAEVTSYSEAVLFLWESHNNVTSRLLSSETQDTSNDPYFPKKYFPEAKFCPRCYHESIHGRHVNRDQVLQFLVKLYTSNSLIRNISENINEMDYSSTSEKIFQDLYLQIFLASILFI